MPRRLVTTGLTVLLIVVQIAQPGSAALEIVPSHPILVSNEVTNDFRLDHAPVAPGTVHFYALGREVAHDDGRGAIVPTSVFIYDEELTGARIPPVVALAHQPLAGTIQGSYDGYGMTTFHDDGLGWLVRDSDHEPIGLILYNTGRAFFNSLVTVDTVWFTYWTNDFPEASGTIDYATGAWTYWAGAGDAAPTSVGYLYGLSVWSIYVPLLPGNTLD